MECINEQIRLVSKIVRGEINRLDVQKELNQMEEKYGEDCFNSYPVKRKPKPWTKEYLKELEMLSNSGAASKEFYLFMAEVSDEVYRKKFIRKIIFTIIIIAIIAGTLMISFWFKK